MTAPAWSLADLEANDPQPHSNGVERRFLCPACGDGHPRDRAHRSLSVNMENGAYQCHRCHEKGKLLDFRTARTLNPRNRAQTALKRAFALPTNEPTRAPPTAHTWREYCAGAKALPGTPAADYLEARGLPAALLPTIARGCLYHSSLYTRGAVLFPFRDQSGEPVAVSARFIDTAGGHRILGTKSLGAFYTEKSIWSAPEIVLTEAPIDALSLHACGVPAVAIGGTSGPEWLPIACGLKRVVLAFDNDDAGDDAAGVLRPLLESYGATVARMKPKDAKDWNEMLQRSDIARLSAYLSGRLAHIRYFDFKLPLSL